MSHAQKHTVVRISLRSMLAITFGVAVVMAVAGPYINALDAEKKWQLLYSTAYFGVGMAIATIRMVYRRSKLGHLCGQLLLALAVHTKRRKWWNRWVLMFSSLPIFVYFAYIMSGSDFPYSLFLPLLYGWIAAQQGLEAWAEGYSESLELCENGILSDNKFHAWKSPALRHMGWDLAEEKLMSNINRYSFAVLVPPEQREAVDAILENYYRASRTTENRKST